MTISDVANFVRFIYFLVFIFVLIMVPVVYKCLEYRGAFWAMIAMLGIVAIYDVLRTDAGLSYRLEVAWARFVDRFLWLVAFVVAAAYSSIRSEMAQGTKKTNLIPGPTNAVHRRIPTENDDPN